MINYNRLTEVNRKKINIGTRFVQAIKNKDFKLNLILILLKNLLFIALLSDSKANGINISLIFMSLPPFIIWIAVNATFISLALFFQGKMQKWIFWILNLLFTVLVIGDIWYYRSNSIFLNYHMFGMTSNLDNLGSSVISMVRPVDFVFITDLIVMAVLNIKNRKKIKKGNRNILGGTLIILISFIYIGYAHVKVDILDGGFTGQMILKGSWNPNQMMGNLTPIGYHIYDGYDFYKQTQPYTFEGEEKEDLIKTLKSINEDNEDNEYAGMMKGKNLIIIQWESLENCVINQSIEGQEITPNLNKLINNSLYFNNFHDQTYGGTSSDAELITNTSVFPVREGTTFFRYPSNKYKYSMPNIFKDLGYSTLASHPDKGSYWNWLANLKSIGYEKCLDAGDYDTSEIINLGMSDKSYLKQFGEVIKEQKNPFLAYTITLTSHSPFDMPEEDRYLNLPSNLQDTKLGGYFQSINYTDKYLGEFLKNLADEGILENTVVAIYGDHEGVHKFYDDEVEAMTGLESWMEKNNKEIPLIIYNKDLEGKVLSQIGGQVDTLPTIAYLFGASKDVYNNDLILGRNLLNTKKSYALLSDRTLLEEGLSEEEKNNIKKLIDYSDEMIRGNYYSDGGWMND
ncbi:MAG: LTA synthase family protein [Clostridiaceae bacterium]|nr:LTA synthase family protein [Clostridiaceae bacterium]